MRLGAAILFSLATWGDCFSSVPTCPYDYRFHGLTLLLHFGAAPGQHQIFECYERHLSQWRTAHGLINFPTHSTLLYGINGSLPGSGAANIEAFMNSIIPLYSRFPTPINFTTPANVDGYTNYASGPGWEYGDSCCSEASMRMRFQEILLQPQAAASPLQTLHAAVQTRFPSGSSSTLSGYTPHISTIYANSDAASDRCVTPQLAPKLFEALDAAGCGLTALSGILTVTSVGLWDMNGKTATEWVMLAEWALSSPSGGR